jgi:hypothetical protein
MEKYGKSIGPQVDELLRELENSRQLEIDRRDKVEDKATKIFAQNSLFAALVAVLSGLISASDIIRIGGVKTVLIGYSFLIVLFFLCAVLSALSSIYAAYPYPVESPEDPVKVPSSETRKLTRVVDLMFVIEHSEYLTNLKVTWLRFAHDFVRVGVKNFASLLAIAFIVVVYQALIGV